MMRLRARIRRAVVAAAITLLVAACGDQSVSVQSEAKNDAGAISDEPTEVATQEVQYPSVNEVCRELITAIDRANEGGAGDTGDLVRRMRVLALEARELASVLGPSDRAFANDVNSFASVTDDYASALDRTLKNPTKKRKKRAEEVGDEWIETVIPVNTKCNLS